MTTREIVKLLREAGFTLFKEGSHHILYKKGGVIVPVCPGRSYANPRAAVSLRAAIRRAARVGDQLSRGRYV